MNPDERAPLIAVAAGAFIAAALLLGIVLLGLPVDEEQPGPAAAASDPGPSFAEMPSGTPVGLCGPVPEASVAEPSRVVASLTVIAQVPAETRSALTYHPGLRALLVPQRAQDAAATAVTLFGESAGTVRIAAPEAQLRSVTRIDGTTTVAGFVESTPHLSLHSDWSVGGREPAEPIHIDLRGLALADVSSMAIHGAGARAYLLDEGRRIVRVDLPAEAADAGGSQPSGVCELTAPPGTSFVAVAVRQSDGHLFALIRDGETDLLQYDTHGRQVGAYRLPHGGPDTRPERMRAIAFGPSPLPAGADEHELLYLLTAARDGGRSILAVAFDPAPPSALQRVGSSLVRSTRTASWMPASADPTGIGWDPARGELVVTDSEADEVGTFQETNVWRVRPDGGVIGTARSRRDEPTGITVTDDGAQYFISDDSERHIQVIDPGVDAIVGTRDDRVAYISTMAFGCRDPEGIAYGQRSLFIADGAGRRVFRLTAGANGMFDGVAPAGDDEVFSFGVGRLGMTDPEGIAYDARRGTVYILDREQGAPIRETTTAGRLLRTIRLGGLGLRSPSGLTVAPSSDDATLYSLYLVDRGVDNAVDATENDGQMIEIRPEAG